MLKYALINNNIVENIITCDNNLFVKDLENVYDNIVLLGTETTSTDADIGSVWKNGAFLKEPEKFNRHEKMQILRNDWDSFSSNIESLKQKPVDELSDDEKKLLEEVDKNSNMNQTLVFG